MIKKLLKYFFEKSGLYIVKGVRYKGSSTFFINSFSYSVVTPSANYSPWLSDIDFLKIYNQIKLNTLVDIYRCYELWELTEKIYKLDKNAGFIEVGVWRGGTAAIIGKKLALLNSKVPFYLADTFTGVKKSTEKDAFYFNN
jgi:O-methyltransferase